MKATSAKRRIPKVGPLHRYSLLILICLAAGVRIYLFAFTYVISRDGVVYLALAGYFKEGNLGKGLSHDFHPLYSLVIAALSYLIPGSALAGQVVSLVSGSLLVVPIYLLGKDLFGQRAGFLTGIIVAFHPYLARVSADVLSEGLYVFLFAGAVCAAWKSLKTRSLVGLFLTGILGALAYLTRPEGIGVVIVAGFWIFMIQRPSPVQRRDLAALGLLVFGFLIFASPYLVYLKKDTGHWILTRKKSIKGLVGIEKSSGLPVDRGGPSWPGLGLQQKSAKSREARGDFGRGSEFFSSHTWSGDIKVFLELSLKFVGTYHPLLIVFLMITFINTKKLNVPDKGNWFLLSFYLLYVPVLYLLLLNAGYVSRRHWLPLVALGLFWAALGMERARDFVQQRLERSGRWPIPSSQGLLIAILAVTLVVLLPKTLKPQRRDKIWIRRAGTWIAQNAPPRSRVMSSDPRVAFYAGGVYVATPGKNLLAGIEEMAVERKMDYLVLNVDSGQEGLADSLASESRPLRLVHKLIDGKEGKTLIYRVQGL